MLNFYVLGFPVGVSWFFWITCILLGGGLTADSLPEVIDVGIWTITVFISVLVHELGHAIAGKRYGCLPQIILHGFGGLTYLPNARFNRKQSIEVSFAGPAAGLMLGCVALIIRLFFPIEHEGLSTVLQYFIYINFFWTFINLLPIQPMDGGQILRDALGPSRAGITAWIGTITATLVACAAFSVGMIFLGIMMVFFAVKNFQHYRDKDGGVITG